MVILSQNQQFLATHRSNRPDLTRLLGLALLVCAIIAGCTPEPTLANPSVYQSNPGNSSLLPGETAQLDGKIGTLRRQGHTAHCTAFCLARDIIATAGHCVKNRRTGELGKLKSFSFDVSQTTLSKTADAANLPTSSPLFGLLSGGAPVSLRAPIEADQDWALIRLKLPVCRNARFKLAAAPHPAAITPEGERSVHQNRSVFMPTRARSGPAAFTLQPCEIRTGRAENLTSSLIAKDFTRPENLLFHNCPLGGLASGTPLLRQTETGLEVVGLHVGTYVRSRVTTRAEKIIQRFSTTPVTNIAIRTNQFTRPVADLVTLR